MSKSRRMVLVAIGIGMPVWLMPASAGGSLGGAGAGVRHIDSALFPRSDLRRADAVVAKAVIAG